MDRADYVLVSMSPAKMCDFSPVQVQKLFFLLDRNIAGHSGGPHFNFVPYDYGPFDREVYKQLRELESSELVNVNVNGSNRHPSRAYSLTSAGQEQGLRQFLEFPRDVQEYIKETVKFVRAASFSELVSSIYSAYPEMKVNSVFVG